MLCHGQVLKPLIYKGFRIFFAFFKKRYFSRTMCPFMCPFFEGTKHPKTQTAEGISPTAVFFLVYKFNYELLLLPMLCHIADDRIAQDTIDKNHRRSPINWNLSNYIVLSKVLISSAFLIQSLSFTHISRE